MTSLRVEIWQSLAELRAHAAAWDDLWRRSDVAAPSARAETVALWIEHYAPQARFRAITVHDDGQLVAAMPLVAARRGKVIPVAAIPTNEWSPSGDLLIDPAADMPAAIDLLVASLRQLPWPLVWLDFVPFETPRWQAFHAGLNRAGVAWAGHRRTEFDVGVVDLERTWDDVQAAWSGNHRRHMRKALRRAEAAGSLTLRVIREFEPDEIDAILRRGFEVEDRSWKGAQSESSVLRRPGMWDFFRRQGRQLAAWNQLMLVFLEFQGQPIGFEYGWTSKGAYFSPKVGYDQAFAQFSPGQLLRLKLLEQFAAARDHRQWDFFGPISDATSKWATGTYPLWRMVVSTSPVAGRLLLSAYNTLRPMVRRLRGGAAVEPVEVEDHPDPEVAAAH